MGDGAIVVCFFVFLRSYFFLLILFIHILHCLLLQIFSRSIYPFGLVWFCSFGWARLVLVGLVCLGSFGSARLVLLGWLGWFGWAGLVVLVWFCSFGSAR